MSLSKPIKFDPPIATSSTPQYSWPHGIQLGMAIGVPVAVAAVVGVCWWKGVFSPAADSPPKRKDKGNQKLEEDDEVFKQTEDTRPVYARLKDQGNDCFKKSNFVKALEIYEMAIKESPPAPELAALFQNRAAVFEKLGDWVQVINESSAALKLNPRYVKALSRRSKAYRQTGFMDEALEDITAVCVLESFSSQASILAADEILKEVGKREAERLMKDKKPTPPSNHSITAFLRAFYCDPITQWWNGTSGAPLVNGNANSNGDTEENSNEPATGFLAARQALKSQRFDNIIDLCTEEIEAGGVFVDEAYLLRGTFRHLWGYGEEVIQDFTKVIESKTASKELKVSAYIKLGSQVAMQVDGSYEEYFQKAEKIMPNCVDIYHQRGQILLTKLDFEGAVAQINKANDICSDFPLAAASKWYVEYRVANITQNEQGISSALKNFNKCLRKFDKSPDVYNLYGQILMEIGRHQEAIAQFDHVIQLDPTNAAIFVHKAVAQYQIEGDINKVLKLLYGSLEVDDKNEFVYETIGTLELQAGNLENAAEAISKALQLAKTSQELIMLSCLKKAAEVQTKVKEKYNINMEIPLSQGNPDY